MLAAAWMGAAALLLLGGSLHPLLLASVAVLLLVLATATAWSHFARQVLSPGDWLSVPGYILAKLPLYARLFTARQVDWVRTRRNSDRD
jgi:hypothetical protein